tara:strand:+ start:598 stop:762 length:165 start_codon:yes stop_codon:yes gene_type:complete
MGLFTSPIYPNIRLTQRNKRHKIFLYEKGESFMQTTLATFFWATIVLLLIASFN